MKEGYAAFREEQEALHNRILRLRFPANFSTLLYLEQGGLRVDGNVHEFTGPTLCYWPTGQLAPICLMAGARSRIIGLSDTLVLDAIGARAESVHLRMLVEQPFAVALETPIMLDQIHTLVGWVEQELAQEGWQSSMSLASYLRLMFISALRIHQPQTGEAGSELTTILRRFRHLVELHYRDHWQVTQYAEQLGIDYDRLHRICKRETGRSPAELVHERLTAEAKARLEKSGSPLKKIAADLGFADATRFSHFFKRRTDMSPGAYRAIVSRPEGEDLVELRRGFSDWP